MNKTIMLLLSFLLFSWISVVAQEKKSEVLIISTIHGAHKVNPNYTYDSLFAFIEKYDPDVIGVEIRNDDIDSSITYLKNNYPFEMYECINKYSSGNVLGFDWLGTDIEGEAIPENYWKDINTVKKIQFKLNADTTILQKLSLLDIIKAEKNNLAMNASLLELNDGRYDLINRIYYEQLAKLLQDSEYIALSDFYQKRDEQIANNIIEIIKSNSGKRMIFLIVADHRDYSLKKVTTELENSINLKSL